ncbi:MAG: hypothetical protein R3F49_00375 [Planctomycetota bacterium]
MSRALAPQATARIARVLLAAGWIGALTCARLSAQVLTPTLPSIGGQFGKALAHRGDLLVVGAPRDSAMGNAAGAVHVYRKSGGRWLFEARLVASNAEAERAFGRAVATDGVRIAATSPWEPASAGRFGAAHLFEWDGVAWSEVALLEADVLEAGDGFGASVALDGERLVVGAPASDRVALDAGVVHTYVAPLPSAAGGPVLHVGTYAAASVGLSDGFGWSLALEGARLAVGAVRDDDGDVNAGALHLATWTPTVSGGWQDEAKLLAAQPMRESNLGTSVSISGDLVVGGAPGSSEAAPGAGSAWVFERLGGAWFPRELLLAPDPAAFDAFGIGVGVDGQRVLVGASHADVHGVDSGKAYVFERSAVTFAHAGTIEPWVGAAADYFGLAVALGDTHGFIGAFGDDRAGNLAGSVHVYDVAALGAPWARPFCFCPQGASCGNLDLDAGCNNSTGHGASFEWWGSPSIAAADLGLAVRDLPAHAAAIVFLGDGAGSLYLTDGRICVGSGGLGVFRTAPMYADAAGALLVATDLAGRADLALAGVGGLAAGQTWNFQAWYRDLNSLCGGGANASSALAVTFAP